MFICVLSETAVKRYDLTHLSVMSVKHSEQHVLFHEYRNFFMIWAIFGSNLSILVRRRYQFEYGEQMYDYAA